MSFIRAGGAQTFALHCVLRTGLCCIVCSAALACATFFLKKKKKSKSIIYWWTSVFVDWIKCVRGDDAFDGDEVMILRFLSSCWLTVFIFVCSWQICPREDAFSAYVCSHTDTHTHRPYFMVQSWSLHTRRVWTGDEENEEARGRGCDGWHLALSLSLSPLFFSQSLIIVSLPTHSSFLHSFFLASIFPPFFSHFFCL